MTLLNRPVPLVDYQFHDGLLLHATASCMAGTFATSMFPYMPRIVYALPQFL